MHSYIALLVGVSSLLCNISVCSVRFRLYQWTKSKLMVTRFSALTKGDMGQCFLSLLMFTL